MKEKNMWEWITKKLDEICTNSIINNKKIDADDIKQDVCLLLLQDHKTAEKIYQEKNFSYLRKIVVRTIYETRGKIYFENKRYFCRFQKIEEICEKYNIPLEVENAYKISCVMEYENYSTSEFSIQHISKLLKEKKQTEILLALDEDLG